jgi:two-component system nitrogen regulation response regulator GlnG/two-component system response regulator HydG
MTGAIVREGDVLEIQNAALFYVTRQTKPLPASTSLGDAFAFGAPDPFGLVGESEAAWELRKAYAFAASTDRHVLVLGESGVGKELAARSIHGLSDRRDRTFVARNAATMPDTLIDAELFGNAKNYPNAGMPERAGLIGEADGSTLFLDEIGDLPEKSQVHLLRVLDSSGEYQRLGEAKTRRSSFKLVAATNREASSLKHDFLARFVHRIEIPGLPERRADIPLILNQLLRSIAEKNPAIADRFFERRDGALAEARIVPDFVRGLLRHPFTHHVRELERVVWLAIGTATTDYIGVTEAVEGELKSSASSATESAEIDRETLEKALADNNRSPTKAAKALGLKNRYVLIRLLKKHGLSAKEDE